MKKLDGREKARSPYHESLEDIERRSSRPIRLEKGVTARVRLSVCPGRRRRHQGIELCMIPWVARCHP